MSTLPSTAAQTVTLAGEQVLLLAGRALYWPTQRLLCVADLHFGKAATYRALGQPVPSGSTQDNLARLDALIAQHRPEQLVFLGDFLHARAALTPTVHAALRVWRAAHPALGLRLVRGNHDQRAGDPPADLRIDVVDEPWILGPFALCHHPAPRAGLHVLAGHIHPCYGLAGRGRQRLRLPCFWSTPELTVLPSFGAFTGGHSVTPSAHTERIWVVHGEQIWPVAV